MLKKIRSKKIVNTIFEKLKKRKKLNLLRYNKNLLNKLNIKKKDYQDFLTLKELDQKFNLNIKDTDIKEFKVEDKFLGNEIFEYLNKINFEELKEINLSNNSLTEIKLSENIKFEKLEKIYFYENKIADINILDKLQFKNLKTLDLDYNQITDINILEKAKFEKLENLSLQNIKRNLFEF